MDTTSDAVGEIILNLFDGFISKANAETITNLNEGLQGQNIISQAFDFIFTLSALIAFFWSFSVSLHGTSPNSRKTADGYAKLFMGLIIGSAKNALGL